MPTVEVPDVGSVEFPDSMSHEEIQAALQEHFPPASQASPAEPMRLARGEFQEQRELSQVRQQHPELETKSLIGLPGPETVPTAKTFGGAIGRAAEKTGLGLAQYMTSEQGAQEVARSFFPTPLAPYQYAKWAYDMISSGVKSTKEAYDDLTQAINQHIDERMASAAGAPPVPPEARQQLVQDMFDNVMNAGVSIPFGLGAGMGALGKTGQLGKGVYDARSQSKAAEIYGALRAQSERGAREVPEQESGARVRTGPEEVAQEAQVSLTPEEQAYIDAERAAIDKPIEIVTGEPQEGVPFAKRKPGQFMGINREKGTIEIYPKEFKEWLAEDVPEANRAKAVRSRLWEEKFHLMVSDAAANAYWGTLTKLERAIERYLYTGEKTPEGQAKYGMNDTLWGHEALRRRMQQLHDMTTSELAELVGKEKWKAKSLEVVSTTVRAIRETLGAKVPPEVLEILNRVDDKIAVAKSILNQPGAQRRQYYDEEAKLRGPFAVEAPLVAETMGPKPGPPQQVLGRLRNVLPPSEYQWYKDQGLEQLLPGFINDPKFLSGWLKENGPTLETRVLKSPENTSEFRQLQTKMGDALHELDSTGYMVFGRELYDNRSNTAVYSHTRDLPAGTGRPPQGVIDAFDRWYYASQRVHELARSSPPQGFDIDHYRGIAPKDADQTAVMVRIPLSRPLEEFMPEAFSESDLPFVMEGAKKGGLWWHGPHFAEEDINTLGWTRIQYETVGGKKVAHIIEAQSDWASERPGEHPLLKDWQRLAFKAAIDQAIKDGADKIALSDPKTVSMTEGHPHIKPGTSINYGKIGPKILSELTGHPGEPVSFGNHQNQHLHFFEAKDFSFGERKTDASGRLYDLAKVKSARADRPFSVFGKDRIAQEPQSPAAQRRKRERAQAGEQPEMFGMMTRRGVVGEEPTAEGRPSGAEVGVQYTGPKSTGEFMAQPAGQISYKDFEPWYRQRIKPGANPEETRAAYSDALYNHLTSASAERLGELRKEARLERLGARRATEERQNLPGVPPIAKEIAEPETELRKSPEQIIANWRKSLMDEVRAGKMSIEEAVKLFKESREDVSKKVRDVYSAANKARNYRNTLIRAIAEKFLGKAQPKTVELARKDIKVDDIDWGKPGAWREITENELGNKQKLEEIFTDEARRSKSDAVNVTRKVGVFRNKAGKIAVLSAYPDTEGGIRVTDPYPLSSRKQTDTLDNVIKRGWIPQRTTILKEPVKNFRKAFDTEKEFNRYLGKEAGDFATKTRSYEVNPVKKAFEDLDWSDVPRGTEEAAPEGMRPEDVEEQMGELTSKQRVDQGIDDQRLQELRDFFKADVPPGVGMVQEETGSFQGPYAKGLREGSSLLTQRNPLSAREAMSVMDFMTDHPKEGFMQGIEELIKLAKNNELKPREWNAIVALRKVADSIWHRARLDVMDLAKAMMKLDPTLEQERAINEALEMRGITRETAYEDAIKEFQKLIEGSEGQADYITKTLGRFGKRFDETGGGAAPSTRGQATTAAELQRAGGVSRELTMRERRPPTAAQPLPSIPPDVPEGTTTPREPTMLSPEDASFVEKEVARQTGYKPTERFQYPAPRGEPFGPAEGEGAIRQRRIEMLEYMRRTKEGESIFPAASRRRAKLEDDFLAMRASLAAKMTRGSTRAQIYADAEGAERLADKFQMDTKMRLVIASLPEGVERKGPGIFGPTKQVREDLKLADKYDGASKAVLAARTESVRNEKGQFTGEKRVETGQFRNLKAYAEGAIARAEEWMRSPNPIRRVIGRRWRQSAVERLEEVEFAIEHWRDPQMQRLIAERDKVDKERLQESADNGITITERANHVPGLYEGESFLDDVMSFGPMRVLGRNYRQPKKFDNAYQAIFHGPYIMINGKLSELMAHTSGITRRMINRHSQFEELKGLKDPVSRKPVAIEPHWIETTIKVQNPETGQMVDRVGHKWVVPEGKLDYQLVEAFGRGSKPLAVLEPYAKSVRAAYLNESALRVPFVGEFDLKPALLYAQAMKHGIVLMWDTFHPFRILQYAIPLGGKKWYDVDASFAGGYSVLNMRAEDIPSAVQKGLVSQKHADWALNPIELKQMRRIRSVEGDRWETRTTTTTRYALAQDLLRVGLNATRITDALYRDAVRSIPFVGERWHKIITPFNKLIFDKITSGVMLESAVQNLERLNLKHPEIPLEKLARDVVRDINVRFGNMGKQGIFKSPTFRDMAQIMFLAPFWQEGLIQSELRFIGRNVAAPVRMAGRLVGGRAGAAMESFGGRAGLPIQGTLGRGMWRGLIAYLIGTQVINLISRGKTTFQEDGNKLDARIPIPGSGGKYWLFSPLSVFAETTHSLMHLLETRPKAWEAIERFGANKAGPLGNAILTLTSGKNRQGEEIVQGSRLAEAGKQLVPGSITVGPWARAVGHAIAPNQVAPNRPGVGMQRLAGMFGLKVGISEGSEIEMLRKAQDFIKSEGLTPPTGWQMIRTDEDSYTKLRHALRNDDVGGAASVLASLRKTHTDEAIFKAMTAWAKRPFTGSQKNETLFRMSLSDSDLEKYYQATLGRQELLSKFYDAYYSVRERE